MKRASIIFLFLAMFSKTDAQTFQTFHDFSAETISGDTLDMSAFAGKKVLVVNTASFCAYTPQFADLQALDSIYNPYNFEVIGFPCNDFGGQDPHDDSTIFNFCTGIYGVTFEMMSKVSITAPDTCDIYKWLQLQSLNGVATAPVTWNFHKFCIDENGHWLMHFPSQTSPLDTAITNWILSGSPSGIVTPSQEAVVTIKNNPANADVSLSITGAENNEAVVLLYSVDGTLVKNIFSGELTGDHEMVCSTTNLANGFYFLQAVINDKSSTFKIAVIH